MAVALAQSVVSGKPPLPATAAMFIKTRILESLPVARPAPLAGGDLRGGDFRAAYGKAVGASAAAEASPAPVAAGGAQNAVHVDASRHVVKPGETLYGIARARLAATGATADAQTSMRYALQLARANHIANPDRIRSGQTLEWAAAGAPAGRVEPATVSGRNGMSVAPPTTGGTAVSGTAWKSGAAESLALHVHDRESAAMALELPEETDESASGVAVHEPSMPFVPALPAFARFEMVAESDGDARLAAAARQIALYEQSAGFAADKAAPQTRGMPGIFAKGVVGTVLDAVPIEPGTRTALQRANTIVSSAMTGRSLAAMTGIGGPILTIAGLIWGIFSSRQNEAAPAEMAKPAADPKQTAQTAPPAAVN